jgi:hypothetical protein
MNRDIFETHTLREAKCLYLFGEVGGRFFPRTLCYQIDFEKEEDANRLVTNFYPRRAKDREIPLHRVLSSLHEELEICRRIVGRDPTSASPSVG